MDNHIEFPDIEEEMAKLEKQREKLQKKKSIPKPPPDARRSKEEQAKKNAQSIILLMERIREEQENEDEAKKKGPSISWDELKKINQNIQKDLDRMKEKEARNFQRRMTRNKIHQTMLANINDGQEDLYNNTTIPEIRTEDYDEMRIGKKRFRETVFRVLETTKAKAVPKKEKKQNLTKISSFFDVVKKLGYAKFEDNNKNDEELRKTWQDVKRCRYLRGYDPPDMRMPNDTLNFVFGK